MRHLFASRVEVLRLSAALVDGTSIITWSKLNSVLDPGLGVGELWCRLDLSFLRPGKDQPMPLVAGRAPDRVGVMYYATTDEVKAGDRIHTLTGPVTGTFEIRAIPDPALDMTTAHHMEVQVIEVAQALAGVYPGGTVNP